MHSDLLTTIIDLLGVFANGLLGGAVARGRNMDLFGFAAMGLVSGLGGGIIRDVLLQHGTPVALTHPAYIPTALAGAGAAFVIRIEHQTWDRVFVLVDAAAISLWATAGALMTLAVGLGWLPAVLLGTITAVGGGATRELMLQHVPAVFTQGPLYAAVAVFVSAVQVLWTTTFGPHDTAGTLVVIAAGIALRLVAYWRGWKLPRGLEWQPGKIVPRGMHMAGAGEAAAGGAEATADDGEGAADHGDQPG
ncbi:MAG TPA: TRIC cation channel family protein [Trebonia sp.]